MLKNPDKPRMLLRYTADDESGKKRALVALGHTILVIAYHMLTRRQPYQDLGAA